MNLGPNLKRLFRKAGKGRCHCGRKLKPPHRRLCGRDECARKFHTHYQRDHARPTYLRSVRRVIRAPGTSRILLQLECGHYVERKGPREPTRAHCDTCKAADSVSFGK